jgi:hypothetical protein
LTFLAAVAICREQRIINMISCDPTVSVGTVLLHAYRIHGDIKFTVHIVKSVLISSVYAAAGEVGSPCKNSLKMEQSVRKQPWWM